MNGLEGLSERPLIIFTTAYSEYAAASYELEALDYLLKPIAFNRFLQAVNRAAKLKQQTLPTFTFVKSGHQYVRIQFDDLLYIQSASNYVDFILKDKKVTVRMKLADAAQLLPDTFVQIHRSYVVNLAHIELVEHNHVLIQSARIAIGQAFKENFLQLFR